MRRRLTGKALSTVCRMAIFSTMRWASHANSSPKALPLRRTSQLRVRMDTAPADLFDQLRDDINKRYLSHKGKLHIVDCCVAATKTELRRGRQFERARFLELLETPESKALRYNFFAERNAAKIADVSAGVRPRNIRPPRPLSVRARWAPALRSASRILGIRVALMRCKH